MRTTSVLMIELSHSMRAYVAGRVESGQFSNPSEYVSALILRDQQEQHLVLLRAMVEIGVTSGEARPDAAEDWVELEAVASGAKV